MDFIIANAFFLLLLLVCVGMHVFGHGHGGHGRGGHHHSDRMDQADESSGESSRSYR